MNNCRGLRLTVCKFACAGFLKQMFMRSTKLSAATKLSEEHETSPIANVLLAVRAFLSTKVSLSKFEVILFIVLLPIQF